MQQILLVTVNKKCRVFVSCLRFDGWLTTRWENGLARPLLWKNFLSKGFRNVRCTTNLVPRVLVTIVQRQNGQPGPLKRSAMTGFLDFQFYCACVQLHVSTKIIIKKKLMETKILGLPVLLRKSGGSLYPRGPCCRFCRWTRVTRTLGTRLTYNKNYRQ